MSEHNSPLSVKPTFLQRVWRSIFPDPLIPQSDRERKRFLLKNLVLHFRPLTVPEKTLNFSLTWGLGGMAAVLILLQFGTGLLLKFAYEPNPITAYASIQSLQNAVMFGQLVRNLHHWGANLLVLIVFLHMLRVYFTGAFLPPRQYNWIIGLSLFGLVLFANLTGYLLPYDQLAFWAVTVSTGMLEYIPAIGIRLQEIIRGGPEIGPASLRIFYALHTAVVPVVLVFFMAFHFWRIRKAGGLVIPRKPDEAVAVAPTRVPTVPNLLLRETTVAVTLIAAVMLLAVFFDAPLEDPANPGLSPNPTKAPWYFAGLQEMLLHLHPTFSVFVIPSADSNRPVVSAVRALPVRHAGDLVCFVHRTPVGRLDFSRCSGRHTAPDYNRRSCHRNRKLAFRVAVADQQRADSRRPYFSCCIGGILQREAAVGSLEQRGDSNRGGPVARCFYRSDRHQRVVPGARDGFTCGHFNSFPSVNGAFSPGSRHGGIIRGF